jgi:hypothetical protein
MFPNTIDARPEITAFEKYNSEYGKHFQEYSLDGMLLFIPVTNG